MTKNIFILDIRFLSISVHVVVLYVVCVMYLYLFSRINYSCSATPFIQPLKKPTFIGLSVITTQLLGIPHARVRTNGMLEKWRFLGPLLLEKVWARKG